MAECAVCGKKGWLLSVEGGLCGECGPGVREKAAAQLAVVVASKKAVKRVKTLDSRVEHYGRIIVALQPLIEWEAKGVKIDLGDAEAAAPRAGATFAQDLALSRRSWDDDVVECVEAEIVDAEHRAAAALTARKRERTVGTTLERVRYFKQKMLEPSRLEPLEERLTRALAGPPCRFCGQPQADPNEPCAGCGGASKEDGQPGGANAHEPSGPEAAPATTTQGFGVIPAHAVPSAAATVPTPPGIVPGSDVAPVKGASGPGPSGCGCVMLVGLLFLVIGGIGSCYKSCFGTNDAGTPLNTVPPPEAPSSSSRSPTPSSSAVSSSKPKLGPAKQKPKPTASAVPDDDNPY